MKKKKMDYYLKGLIRKEWIEFQIISKREGISAAEKLRRFISKTVKGKKT